VNAWKVILSTLVIFIAGVVTGGLLVTFSSSMVFQALRNQPKPPNSANPNPNSNANAAAIQNNPFFARNRDLLRRMDRELELTPEQHQHIETIMADFQERTKTLWKPIAPQMNKEMQLVRNEIRDQLTPEQKKKYDGFKQPRPGQERKRLTTNAIADGATNSIVPSPLLTNSAATN